MATKNGANLGVLSFALPWDEHYEPLNRFYRWIDGLLQSRVISFTTTSPPATPDDGDVYIVPAGASGAWAGQEHKIARWNADIPLPAWEFLTPKKGWSLRVSSGIAGFWVEFDGTEWRSWADLPEYADQAAASSLETGELFRTSAGAILVKL